MIKNRKSIYQKYNPEHLMKKNNPQTTEEFFMKRIFSLLLILSALVMTFSGCGLFEPGNASLGENKIENDATGGNNGTNCNTNDKNLVYFGTIAGFASPNGMVVADDKLYVGDGANNRVQIYTNLSGVPAVERTIGAGSAVADNTGFSGVVGVAIANSKLYVVDVLNSRVQVYNLPIVDNDEADATIGTGSVETNNSGFNRPHGVEVANDRLYVAEIDNHRVQIYTNLSGTPTYERTIGTTGVAQTNNSGFNRPHGVEVANGRLYVGDWNNGRVQVYTNLSGTPTYEKTLPGINGGGGLEVANGKLYVTDWGNHRVQIYNISYLWGTTTYDRTLGTMRVIQTDNSGFHYPSGVMIHGSKLYITDGGNSRIQIYEWR